MTLVKPKNTSNKTYSKLPSELTQAISEEFEDTFKRPDFVSFAQVYLNEIVLRVGYRPKGSIKQINFDLSANIEPEGPKPVKILEQLIDSAKELFHSYFKDEDIKLFSPVWARVANTDIDYKFDGTNTELEEAANKLLGESIDEDIDSEPDDENSPEEMLVGDFSELDEIEKIVETLKKTKVH